MKKTLLTNILILAGLSTQANGQQATEENPIDRTSYIVNPSFEDNTNGWASEQLATQTNAEFKRKYILETVDWYLDFSHEIKVAVKKLAESLDASLTELSFLYSPIESWKL